MRGLYDECYGEGYNTAQGGGVCKDNAELPDLNTIGYYKEGVTNICRVLEECCELPKGSMVTVTPLDYEAYKETNCMRVTTTDEYTYILHNYRLISVGQQGGF